MKIESVAVRSLLLSSLLALSAPLALGLGFGEIKLRSALNQPLVAEIPLRDLGDLNEEQVVVKIAGVNDFKRAGVELTSFLTKLKLKLVLNKSGNAVVQITSRDPVVEPYLDFLVEARWPDGRALREYTVLLDLPDLEASGWTPVSRSGGSRAGNTSTGSVERVVGTEVERIVTPRDSGVMPRTGSERQALPSLQAGDAYRVQHYDTLAKVATMARPSNNVTIEQTMLALQRKNPDAFQKGNVNRLKSGYVLRFPTEAEARQLSADEAQREVSYQTDVWKGRVKPRREPLSGKPSPGGASRSGAGTASPATSEEPRLSIAAAGSGDAEGGDADAGGGSSLRDQLTANEENLDRAKRQSSDIAKRLADMDAQLATLQNLATLKNEQLAMLKAQLSKQAGVVKADRRADEQAALAAAPAETTANSDGAPSGDSPSPAPGDGSPAEQAAADTDESGQTQGINYWVNKVTTPVVAGWRKVDDAIAAPLESAGVSQPILRYALEALVALLLLWLLKRLIFGGPSRAAERSEPVVTPVAAADEPQEADDEDFVQTPALTTDGTFNDNDVEADSEHSGLGLAAAGAALTGAAAAGLLSDDDEKQAVGGFDLEDDAPLAPETGDAISEAEIYIAYGRYDQAAELLTSAIKQDPQNFELRHKLLDIYIDQRDRDGFTSEYAALKALGNDVETGKVKDALVGVDGTEGWLDDAAPTELLLDEIDEPLVDEFEAPTVDDDREEVKAVGVEADDFVDELEEVTFEPADTLDEPDQPGLDTEDPDDFDLDDLELELGEDPAPTDSLAAELDKELEDDLDFELDLDDEVPAAADSLSGGETDDEFDLDLLLGDDDDDELGSDSETAAPGATDADDEFSLDMDFDDELDTDPATLADLSVEPSTESAPSTETTFDAASELGDEFGDDFSLDLDEDAPAAEPDDEGLGVGAIAGTAGLAGAAAIGAAALTSDDSDSAEELAETSVEKEIVDDAGAASTEVDDDEFGGLDFDMDGDFGDLGDVAEPEAVAEEEPVDDSVAIDYSRPSTGAVTEFNVDADGNLDAAAAFGMFDAGADAELEPVQDASLKLDASLELAGAYVEMGNVDAARPLLDSVVNDGDHEQRERAIALLGKI